MYIVKYSEGEYEDFRIKNIFVTHDKEKAYKYVTKFNKLHKKWEEYYKRYEGYSLVGNLIKDEYVEYFDRWHKLNEINRCYIEKIDVR